MNSLLLLAGALFFFFLAFKVYGRFLNRLYRIDPNSKTPAHTRYDGTDFVPAKNWIVLFGHHFSSICGAGPIIGPVLAVAYWGWAPSLLWILLGAVLLGAVADYSSLVVSIRSRGDSIAEISGTEISRTARIFFSLFIWISLILIIAVFSILAAKTFILEKSVVIPSVGLIPVALVTGFLLYRTRLPGFWPTLLGTSVGLGALLFLLWYGKQNPVGIPDLANISSQNIWVLFLLLYCFAASVTPVNLLLQPRDYLAAYLLFFAILIGLISIFIVHPPMNPVLFSAWNPEQIHPEAGPLFPMLFVTIACGAISGFHSLVSSGTTSKQIDRETDACRIGYGGMLTEGLVGVIVLIAVSAGLSRTEFLEILKTGGALEAYATGFGRLSSFFLGENYGKVFANLALNAFILTTLDTATRIARYLTMDLFRISNKYAATIIVVFCSGALALTGQWMRLWPAFGTANQLIAGLALLVAACWIIRRKGFAWPILIPAVLMLVITTTAFTFQLVQALTLKSPNYFIAVTSFVLIILSLIIFWESLTTILRKERVNKVR